MISSRKWTYSFFARRLSTALKHLFLISIALFSLAPLLWLISIAFRPVEETYIIPMKLFPSTLTLENARLVIEMLPKLVLFYRNSFIITGSSVFLILLISLNIRLCVRLHEIPWQRFHFLAGGRFNVFTQKHVHTWALRGLTKNAPD